MINKESISHFLELSKVRMVPMVLITATYGYVLGAHGFVEPFKFIFLMLAIALVSVGSASLNNYLEKDVDIKMKRTCNRVLPTGKLSPLSALIYGIVTVMAGVFLMVLKVNLLSGFLMLLASFLYVLVYTPMKRWSWLNTFVGAIPGAIPPMAGWAASTGRVDVGAWLLFLILFTWQHPHFYAIALMHREDYARGGFKMLPVIDETGKRTFRQIIVYLLLLIGVSVMPTVIGLTGNIYLFGTIFAGIYFLVAGIRLCLQKNFANERKLFLASLVYLPALLLLMVVDLGLKYLF